MEFIKSNIRRRGDEQQQQQQQQASPDGAHASPPQQNPYDDVEEQRVPEMAQQGRGDHAPTERRRFSLRFPVVASRRAEPNRGRQEQEPGRPSEMIESPKTPQFNINMPALPSTRLHLPNLARTWTRGESGPESRPPTAAQTDAPEFGTGAPPPPPPSSAPPRPSSQTEAAAPDHGPSDDRPPSLRRSRTERFPVITFSDHADAPTPPAAPRRSHRSNLARRFRSTDPAEMHLAELADRGRRRRHRDHGREGEERSSSSPLDANGKPKRFLFCFPWVASRRMRGQILRVFVSGLFLLCMLAAYLALSLTRNISNGEFTILLILIILVNTVFFCHSLVRLCIFIVRPASLERRDRSDGDAAERAMVGPNGDLHAAGAFGPGGYAIPRRPIRVLLARDEEAAGLESETAKLQPPAYGLWRESVRVDPNRIYWARNDQLPPPSREGSEPRSHRSSHSDDDNDTATSENTDDDASSRRPATAGNRPPSYASEDGVSYVVEARPRSMAPLAVDEPPVTPLPAPSMPSAGGERLLVPERRG